MNLLRISKDPTRIAELSRGRFDPIVKLFSCNVARSKDGFNRTSILIDAVGRQTNSGHRLLAGGFAAKLRYNSGHLIVSLLR